MEYDVLIVGGGVAGLTCAIELYGRGKQVLVLEKNKQPGGRIATEKIGGFLLDRGFQVVQTGYPDIGSYLDLDSLALNAFPSGVMIRYGGTFYTIADPRKHWASLISTLTAPVGTLGDRLRMFSLTRSVCGKSMEEIFQGREETAFHFLKKKGFTDTFINSFFVPFFAGATLERSLNASSEVLQYLVRVFAMGEACLPAEGMATIPRQLAARLPAQSLRCGAEVERISGQSVILRSGEEIRADRIVIATEDPAFKRLFPERSVRKSVSETSLYFQTERLPPVKHPFLILNGESNGPINNIAFPSMVAQNYAPYGKTLIAAVVLDREWQNRDDLVSAVQAQCTDWFGQEAKRWSHLKTYTIEHALPDQSPPLPSPFQLPKSRDNIVVCGEHQGTPGLLWAMMSGRRAAEKISG